MTSIYILSLYINTVPSAGPYTAPLQSIREGGFSHPAQVAPPSSLFINLGFIIINMEQHFVSSIRRTFRNIFLHSSGQPLHCVIVTDQLSASSVRLALAELLSLHLVHQLLSNTTWSRRRALPPIRFSFVDIEDVIGSNRGFVDALKRQSINGEDVTKDKYASDLFYIAPLYHLAFLAMDRIIFLDSTDLLFMSDVKDLDDLYRDMDSDAVMMIGLDLSPHYRVNLEDYIKTNPDTRLGLPGRYQGLNTGVALYALDKMRASARYNENLTPDKVEELFTRYQMKMSVGDQDWLTLLSFQEESLFSILPCQYNAQTSLQYWHLFRATFSSYHQCGGPSTAKIVHFNGCGPEPQSCGSPPARIAEYREHINVVLQVIPMHNLWVFLGQVHNSHTKLNTKT